MRNQIRNMDYCKRLSKTQASSLLGFALVAAMLSGCGGGGGGGSTARPAGDLVVFQSNRDGDTEIFLMNGDGSGQTQVTKNTVADTDPRLSPDGSQIVFRSRRAGDSSNELYIMNLDGAHLRRLTNNTFDELRPDFSRDGKFLVYTSSRTTGRNLFKLDLKTGEESRITFSPLGTFDGDPTFAPDGRIVFASGSFGNQDLFVVDANGGTPQLLVSAVRNQSQPALSPDGRFIAYVSDEDGNSEIYLMKADGTNRIRLTTNSVTESDPEFSPDGKRIYFARSVEGNFDIFITDALLSARPPVRLTRDAGIDRLPDVVAR